MATVDRLEERIEAQIRGSVEQLARRAVQLYRLRAIFWAVALSILTTIGCVAIDYLLHVEETGWRWLLSLLWLAGQTAIAWRLLPEAARFKLTPIQVARWIERRRPELGDSLSRLLSVADLPESDARFGSVELRRAVVGSCDANLAALPWHSFIERRPTIVAGCLCAVGLVTVSVWLAVAGPLVFQGLTRLAKPWAWAPWPRSEQMQLVDPPGLIARDSELEVRVVDLHPPFPELVELEFRMEGGEKTTATNNRLPMRVTQSVQDGRSQLAVVTLPAMAADFSMRPIGGDQQDGPWHSVRVATQPQLKEYAFTIRSPDYVHQADTELVGHRIDVLAGSRVTLRGRFDQPLKSLRAWSISASQAPSSAPGSNTDSMPQVQVWPAVLSDGGLAFELFASSEEVAIVESDRRWQFELETDEGLHLIDSKQWMIHVNADRPPAVALAPIQPGGVTRNATLIIQGSASDDLGVADVELSWQLPNQSPQSLRLWPSSEQNNVGNPSADGKSSTASLSAVASTSLRSVEVSTPWSVAAAALSAGQTITLELVARDSAGQVGRSVPQTLEIVDDAAALANLQSRQAELFGPLRQLLDSQRRNQQSLSRTVDIARQLEEIGPEQVGAVEAATQLGQSIVGNLTRNQNSLAHQLEELSTQLDRNQLSETPLASDVDRLRSQIEALANEQLTLANQELDKAQRALRDASSRQEREHALEQLSKATQLNQKATDQFGELVDSVAMAESLAELQKQIQELANEQSALAKQTAQLQLDTVVKGSSPQADAQRAGIQSDQQNLARRLEEFASSLDKELHQAAGEPMDSGSRKQIERAHAKLLESRPGDQMRRAAALLKEGQLSDADALQRRIESMLGEVVAELGGNNASGLESSSASLQDLAKQLSQLASRQQQSAEALKRSANGATPDTKRGLTAEQQSMRDDVEQLNAEPSIQTNQRLQELLKEATSSIDRAVEQTEQEKFNDASDHAREAANSLNTAAQSAMQRAERLQSQVTEQQILDLRVLLAGAIKRQQPVVDRLEKVVDAKAAKSANPNPTDSSDAGTDADAATTTSELLTTERQVQQQLLQGRERLQSLDAFDWLLGQCDEELLRTIAALQRQRMDPETLASARAALEMMQAAETAVADAAHQESQSPNDDAQGKQAGEQQSSEQRGSKLPMLASLRLLRQMQLLINQQSQQTIGGQDNVDTRAANAPDSALVRMADRQQALAEQVARLREQLKQSQQ